jgi:hypothetical protein
MQHALLLNPFSLGTEQVQTLQEGRQENRQEYRQEQTRLVSPMAVRSTPVCASCQSDDIICFVPAQWSNEQQQWEIANTFDQPAHCNHCNATCDIAWRAL